MSSDQMHVGRLCTAVLQQFMVVLTRFKRTSFPSMYLVSSKDAFPEGAMKK